jgi:predicted nucleic acid-binding protein
VIRHVVIDAGSLVALVNAKDQWHEWARSQLGGIVPPILTCEAVLSEACFLAQRAHGGIEGVLGFLDRGIVESAFELKKDFRVVTKLIRRYVNVPMSFAGACLVRMSELIPDCVIFTLDTDFRIYRRHRRQMIPLLMPDEL